MFFKRGYQITLYLVRPSQIWGTKEGVGRFGGWDPLGRSGPPPKRFFAILAHLSDVFASLQCTPLIENYVFIDYYRRYKTNNL